MIALTHLAGKKAAVLGLGRAGLAAVQALRAGGAEALAWDDTESTRQRATDSGASIIRPEDINWQEVACLVLSPGIPFTHPQPHKAVVLAQEADCPVIGDVELLTREQTSAHTIGITGTNGKSTTTALITHLLQHTGRQAVMGGNIGVPALALDPPGDEGSYVLELSSYQLDLLDQFHCNIALWLNITPDHLERHGGMEGYITAKRRIFRHMTAKDTAIIGIDDADSRRIYEAMADYGEGPLLIALTGECKPEQLPTECITFQLQNGHYQLQTHLRKGKDCTLTLAGCNALRGAHNAQNAAAALAVGVVMGLKPQAMQEGMQSFPGLAHRMEEIAMIRGVRFVNDSKATNAEAAAKALAAYEPIYWIAGGVPKAGGISSLFSYASRIRKAYLIGEAADSFATTLKGQVETVHAGTLDKAVQQAAKDAFAAGEENATILFSPACASFDQFKDFEQRGEVFRECVGQIDARYAEERVG